MKTLTIIGGCDKAGKAEKVEKISMKCGEIYTIVGNTGSGKSRLIKDVEQLAHKDTVSKRTVLVDGLRCGREMRMELASGMVAHLGQNMRFMLDITVAEFLKLHAECRGRNIDKKRVLELVNEITPEPVDEGQNLNLLSGGQTRSLMIADIALICDSPVVLIDEIENAGIDKEKAFRALLSHEKLVLAVTHDSHTALMAKKRIVMGNGAMQAVIERTAKEARLFDALGKEYRSQQERQKILREGGCLDDTGIALLESHLCAS